MIVKKHVFQKEWNLDVFVRAYFRIDYRFVYVRIYENQGLFDAVERDNIEVV